MYAPAGVVMETSESIDDDSAIDLSDPQAEELFDDDHRLIFHVGGRGSGKTYIDALHFLRRAGVQTDQLYAIFANTYTQLHGAIVPQMTEMLTEAGVDHVYEHRAPEAWRRRWRRQGVKVPKTRLRDVKIWIWENGVHLYLGTLANNAWTRIKSFELAMALVEEGFEDQVPKKMLTYLLGSVRCGWGKRVVNGVTECKRRGHNHQIIVKGNVPLNNPSHWVYQTIDDLLAKEEQRKLDGKEPFFRLITSDTRDNVHLNQEFHDGLAAALDPDTYDFVTRGSSILERNTSALVYHAFSEHNILPTLTYDPLRPLHLWFDFNVEPSIAGWAHELSLDEVPREYISPLEGYVGIVGEWFSESPMTTEQLAHALCEDPTIDQRCVQCPDMLTDHIELGDGWLCRRCGQVCSGDVRRYTWDRKPLHATANWRGLMRHRGRVYVYADATGGARHADASQLGGAIGILREVLLDNLGDRVTFLIKQSNPAISMRLLAVNRGFHSQNRIRRIFVLPLCTAHINDFRRVMPDPKTGHPRKVTATAKNKTRSDEHLLTHASDGFGYFYEYRWPAVMPSTRTVASIGTLDGPSSFLEERSEDDDWKNRE